MARIHDIVSLINTSLQDFQFADRRFQRGKWYGIVERIMLKDGDSAQMVPSILDYKGRAQKIIVNDSYPFMLYHRVISQTGARGVAKDDFGDMVNVTMGYDMRMVMIADREIIKLTKEDLIAGIIAGMPANISSASVSQWGLKSASIDAGLIVRDDSQVYAEEYALAENMLTTRHIMVAINYRVTTSFYQNCFKICEYE